jgi:hypothetical protein
MRRLSIVLWLLLISIVFVQAKTYVVCVGIADYPGKSADLRVSDNDAKTIAKVFLATKDASVRILVNEQATQSALLSTMHTTFEDANHNDAVILFFSGHGAPGALACYDGLLTYQHIFRMLKGCKAKRKIIIADACYSGKMRTNKQHSTHHTSQNVMFFLSSRSNEESQETKYKNSLFTIFLERGLRGGADKNRDRKITAQELFNFVHYGVIDWSKGGQHPVMWGKFDNDMTIIKWK